MKRISSIIITIVFIIAGAGPLSAGPGAFAAEEPLQTDEVTEPVDQTEPAEAEEPIQQDEQTEPTLPAPEADKDEQAAPAETDSVTETERVVMKAQQVQTTAAAKTAQPPKSRAKITKLKRPAIASLTGIKYKKICVRWTADVNADGYEIYYKTAKKKKKIVKTKAAGKYILKKLKNS